MGGGVMRGRTREPFVMLPIRFIDAELRGELSERQGRLLRFIARRANEARREARLTLAEIAAALRSEVSPDTVGRELKSLRPEWIDFESGQGRRRPYVIRLTGLAVEREGDESPRPEAPTSARPPHDLRRKAPQEPPHERSAETDETYKSSGKPPPQEPPHDFDGSPLPLTSTEGSEVNAGSEEKLDHVVGKTTDDEPPLPNEPEFPPLLDAFEPNPYHENGDAQPPPDPSLGTASLGELHRRHERGEL